MPEPPAPLLFFRVSGETFSLPLAAIREVALPGPLSRIPKAPGALPGVMNLRGRIVVVVDAGLLLRDRSARTGNGAERILVLDEGRRDVGLLVSEVLLIANLGGNEKAAGTSPEAPDPGPDPAQRLSTETLVEKIAVLFGPT
ncbi:MAG: chemotaxis protein CheW [Myxococcales bacterium]